MNDDHEDTDNEALIEELRQKLSDSEDDYEYAVAESSRYARLAGSEARTRIRYARALDGISTAFDESPEQLRARASRALMGQADIDGRLD